MTLEKMHRAGLHTVGDLRGRKPEIPSWLLDVYELFFLLDRDGMSGRVRSESMRGFLDELGVVGFSTRVRVMKIWRRMDDSLHETRERLREEKGDK